MVPDVGPRPVEPGLEAFADDYRGRRALVTGATGFLGSHLSEALAALDAEVLGLSRERRLTTPPAGVTLAEVDLANSEEARRTIVEFRPDIVFHLAGRVTGAPDSSLLLPTLRANLLATVNVLLAAREVGRPTLVWPGTSDEPAQGGSPPSPYAASKAAARVYLRLFADLYELPVVLVRLFTVYGPRQPDTKLVPHTILSFLRGERPRLAGAEQRRDFLFVEDAVRGLLSCGAAPGAVGAETDLGSGTATPTGEVVRRLKELTGARVEPDFGALPARSERGAPTADTAQARALLGWEPRWSLDRGLEETVAWYRARVAAGTPAVTPRG